MEILHGIFLGGIDSCCDDCFDVNSIKRVLSVCYCAAVDNDQIQHKLLPVKDNLEADLMLILPEALAFIEKAVEANENLLIHDYSGRSRSPAIMIAHLMKRYSIGYDAGLTLLKSAYPEASPNINFASQLRQWHSQRQMLLTAPLEPPTS